MKEFIFPERVIWDKETYRDNYGKVVVEPLERGYGITLGNTLRRVLLSSIEGVAITAIKIDGISHEFTTIKGVKEDVVEIVLNLKQVALKPLTSEFPRMTEVEIVNKEEICAGDLINDGSVEVLNKDLHIATLTPETKLKLHIEISKGRGYLPYEKMKMIRPASPIGTILIDGLFSPVRKVSFNVENTRVGQFVDYEKLILEVWTTGAVAPMDVMKEAISLINKHFSIIVEHQKLGREAEEKKIPETEEKQTIDLDRPISEIKLSTRILNGLLSAKIRTLRELVSTPREKLEEIKNLGKKSISDLENILKEMGLKLKTEEELKNEGAK